MISERDHYCIEVGSGVKDRRLQSKMILNILLYMLNEVVYYLTCILQISHIESF